MARLYFLLISLCTCCHVVFKHNFWLCLLCLLYYSHCLIIVTVWFWCQFIIDLVQCMSEWVGFNILPEKVYVISGWSFQAKCTRTHNNATVSLTFTENPNVKCKTQKQPKPNIVRTRHYNCAYVRLMAVLIIVPVILQAVINLIMLSVGGAVTRWRGQCIRLH